MLRSIVTAALRTSVAARVHTQLKTDAVQPARLMSTSLMKGFTFLPRNGLVPLVSQKFLEPLQSITSQDRTLTKFSLIKGKRKSVKAVLKRFKRLDWGGWIRTHSGRHKKLFKKSTELKRRLRQHVFVNAQQSWLLDKMVTRYWRKPKYYVDDPYRPYHKRDEYWATRRKPVEI